VSESPAKVSRTREGVAIRTRIRQWSRQQWRRALTVMLILFIFVCIGLPMLVAILFGFNQPPYYVTDVREYQVNGRLALVTVMLVFVIGGLTWILGVLSASAGGAALGGGTRSLRKRLLIVRRRFQIPLFILLLLQAALFVVVSVAAAYAAGNLFGPRITTGFPYSVWDTAGASRRGLLLGALLIVPFLVGPYFRVRLSAALGAFAANFTHGRAERIAYALGGRFGLGLAGTLFTLWGGTSLILTILTIFDPVSSQYSYSVGPFDNAYIFGIPTALYLLVLIGYLFVVGQAALGEIFTILASRPIPEKKMPLAPTEAAASIT